MAIVVCGGLRREQGVQSRTPKYAQAGSAHCARSRFAIVSGNQAAWGAALAFPVYPLQRNGVQVAFGGS